MSDLDDFFYGEDYPFDANGSDTYGDRYRVFVTQYGDIELRVEDTLFTAGAATHCYTPEDARKLAKRLKKAARLAEELR